MTSFGFNIISCDTTYKRVCAKMKFLPEKGTYQNDITVCIKPDNTWNCYIYERLVKISSIPENLTDHSLFVNFFEKRAKYPRFKSRHGKQSLIYPQNVKLAENKIYFPKLNWIDAVIHRSIEGSIRTVTITKNTSEQYYASVMFEDEKEKPKPTIQGKAIGLDLGLTHFCITSDSQKFDNPRWFKKHEHNLKVKQQQLSRKQKGSNNRNKSRLLVD